MYRILFDVYIVSVKSYQIFFLHFTVQKKDIKSCQATTYCTVGTYFYERQRNWHVSFVLQSLAYTVKLLILVLKTFPIKPKHLQTNSNTLVQRPTADTAWSCSASTGDGGDVDTERGSAAQDVRGAPGDRGVPGAPAGGSAGNSARLLEVPQWVVELRWLSLPYWVGCLVSDTTNLGSAVGCVRRVSVGTSWRF